MGLLRASWPVLPDYAVAMLRCFQPAFVWRGAAWSGGAASEVVQPGEPEVLLFLRFVEQVDCNNVFVCPAHLRAEVQHARERAEAKGGGAGGRPTGAWLAGSSDEEEEEELDDAQRLADFRGDDATDDGVDKLTPPRVSVVGVGSDDYSRVTCSEVAPVVPISAAGGWFSAQYAAHTAARGGVRDSASAVWSRDDLLGANREQRVAIVCVLDTLRRRHAGESVPPLRALVSGTAGTGLSPRPPPSP